MVAVGSQTDREILRALAGKVRVIADLPEMASRRRRWVAHNTLRAERPMVLCFPEGCWHELVPQDSLKCSDEKLRAWEMSLRMKLFWWEHIHDDGAIDPWFDIQWRVHQSNFGVEIPRVWGDNRGSYVWDPPLKDLKKDLGKLHPRTFSVDREATHRDLELANEIFGDLLPARIHGPLWWSVGLTQTVAFLIGIEDLMIAMIEQPDSVHQLMAFLRDDMMRFVDWTEREGLLTPRNAGDYVGSGGLAYTDELPGGDADTSNPTRLSDIWGFGESQETVGISPNMFSEFVMPYQKPILDKFGLNCYGCCEGLEHRIDVVKRNVPRLRRISVSPKADQPALAEQLDGKFIYSRKADPVPVCVDFNEDAVRRDVRRTLDLAKNQPLEIILKDTHTVQGDPTRITRWVKAAREEIEKRE